MIDCRSSSPIASQRTQLGFCISGTRHKIGEDRTSNGIDLRFLEYLSAGDTPNVALAKD
jgi:hypothetical protein